MHLFLSCGGIGGEDIEICSNVANRDQCYGLSDTCEWSDKLYTFNQLPSALHSIWMLALLCNWNDIMYLFQQKFFFCNSKALYRRI